MLNIGMLHFPNKIYPMQVPRNRKHFNLHGFLQDSITQISIQYSRAILIFWDCDEKEHSYKQ